MNPFSLAAIRALMGRGILGMNRRNISYISRYNPRGLFPVVDNKLKTKKLAMDYGVAVPELIGVITNQHDVLQVEGLLASRTGFCIKPAKGSGGKGILVITRTDEGVYYRSNGQPMGLGDVQRHVSNILAGLFSLGGAVDVAVIEALIEIDPALGEFSHEGVPDLRVIVFRGIPVMAMMRLASASSHGKANLHQGAVGVGIDICTGAAVKAVQREAPITHHPDNGRDLTTLKVPRWSEMLEISCACADMTGLGYLGVDLVLDRNQGPTMLELNARPGLSIQIANGAGLVPRLRLVEKQRRLERLPISQRVAFAQTHFCAVPLAETRAAQG